MELKVMNPSLISQYGTGASIRRVQWFHRMSAVNKIHCLHERACVCAVVNTSMRICFHVHFILLTLWYISG